MRRVVVTGLGIVSSIGTSKEEVLASLRSGSRMVVRPALRAASILSLTVLSAILANSTSSALPRGKPLLELIPATSASSHGLPAILSTI